MIQWEKDSDLTYISHLWSVGNQDLSTNGQVNNLVTYTCNVLFALVTLVNYTSIEKTIIA